MQFVWKTFLKGLATALPVTLTLYLILLVGCYSRACITSDNDCHFTL